MGTEYDSDTVIVLRRVDKVWELESERGLWGGYMWCAWTLREIGMLWTG